MSFGFGFGFPSQASATGGATLSLNFAGATSLDPKITFTRASTGSYYGSNGLLALTPVNLLTYSQAFDNAAWTKSASYVQTNLLLYSEQFDNAAWAKGAGVTVTANSTVAPDGTLTADNVAFATGGSVDFLRTSPTMTVGVVYTMSVYALRVSGTPTFSFDIGNGGGGASTAQTPTTTWQRFTFTFTFAGANSWIDLEASGPGTIAFWGAQLVQGAVAGDYQVTTSAAAAVQYASPTGSLTADKLVETTATGGHLIDASLAVVSGTVYANSAYIKAGERTIVSFRANNDSSLATFNLLTGAVSGVTNATAEMVNVGGGWYRCSLVWTATSTASVIALRIRLVDGSGNTSYTGDGTSGLYLWGAQLQTGSTATTYIPTTATASGAPRFDYDPAAVVQQNLLTYSEQFDNAAWVKNASGTGVTPVVTANYGAAPDGTATADRVQLNSGGAGNSAVVQITGSFIVGPTYSFSIWLKSLSGNVDVTLFLGDAVTNVTVTTSWQRFVYVNTPITGNEVRFAKREIWGSGGAADLLAWGAQLNTGSTALPYLATTSSALTVTGVQPKGLLIEEQRTNLLTYSQDFTNAIWTKTNITLTPNSAVAPDGTTTASTYAVATSAATISWQDAVATSTTLVYTIYVKQNTGPTDANSFALFNNTTATVLSSLTVNYSTGAVTHSVGSGATATNVGNGWWRLSVPISSGVTAGNSVRVYPCFVGAVETAGEAAYIWGAQLEAGAFATSYIPTVAAQVTRAADNAVMTGTNFSSWYNQTAGSFFASASGRVGAGGSAVVLSPASNAPAGFNSSPQIDFLPAPSLRSVYTNAAGSIVAQPIVSIAALNTTYNMAASMDASGVSFVVNGGTAATSAIASLPAPTSLTIGSVSTQYLNGHIRSITYWPRRLSNAELQGVTA